MALLYKYQKGNKLKSPVKLQRSFDEPQSVALYGDLTPEILDNLQTKNGYILSESDKKYQTKMPSKEREEQLLKVYFTMLDNGVSPLDAKRNLMAMAQSYGSWRNENVGKSALWGFDHADIPEWLSPNSEFKKPIKVQRKI